MNRRPRISSRGIVLAYVLVAGAWIAFSDQMAATLVRNPDALAAVSTLKGWAFVAVTAALLAGLLVAHDAERARQVSDQQVVQQRLARLNRVLRTLSVANQALVRAADEQALLQAFCEAIVQEGAFVGAWVGYAEEDQAGRIRPLAWSAPLHGYLSSITVTWRDEPEGRGPTGTAVRERRTVVSREIATDPIMGPWRARALAHGYASSAAVPLRADDVVIGALTLYAAEPNAFGTEELALLEELAADLAYGIAALRTRAAAARAEADRRRLATAVEQSDDAVMITDLAATIEHVNPAFERLTGYTRTEVLGQNARILRSGEQPAAFYTAMWGALTAGRTWRSDLVNRRKDGSLVTVAETISPIRDAAGSPSGYVAVLRDVTAQRAAEARAVHEARERELLAAALAAVRPYHAPEETAQALCIQIARLPGTAAAVLSSFDPDGRGTILGAATAAGVRLPRRRPGVARSRYLRSRALDGPWIEAWTNPHGSPFGESFRELGIRALAHAPLVVEGAVRGLLVAASAEADATAQLTERLPALVQFAGIAAAVLGPSLLARVQSTEARARVGDLLARRAFGPVFQPIVDLEHGTAIGFEALTRFADGTPPDEQFRAAAAAGLRPELEAATLRAALEAAAGLPDAAWLSVNVSAAFVLAGEPLRTILRAARRPLVLEVTEEEAIPDYPAVRAAMAALGPDLRLAVDDAGAGFASLRHISELRPALIKVDRTLVAAIDSDPIRQALLAGLRHFGDAVSCTLVAEGIETDAELAALRSLGVQFGQGYLLGRPAPLGQAAAGMGA
jgi:PAS domain S-box-containing protein